MKPFLLFRLGFLFCYVPLSLWVLAIGAGIVIVLFTALMAHEEAFERAHPQHGPIVAVPLF